jgi:hypothetical protein
MQVERVAADRVRAHVPHGAVGRKLRVVEDARTGATEVGEPRVADVHVGTVDEQHVPAHAARIRRADDDVARQVADVRQELQRTIRPAGTLVIEGERRASA